MQKLLIETERLQIRNLKTTDLADFHFYRYNPEVTKYQGFDFFTEEQAKDFIQEQLNKEFGKAGEWVQYAIEDKKEENWLAIVLSNLTNTMLELHK